jgi:hypothetical protein
VLAIAMMGGALEYYEFIVFGFMVPILSQVFFSAGEPWLRWQGLSEVPFMQDVKRWGVLTIGTGLGNARFSNRNGKGER